MERNSSHQLFRKMMTDIEKYLAEQLASRVQIEETGDAYHITVFRNGIEHPGDIKAQYRNGHLYLQRTMQLQKKTNTDSGAVWQSYTEHFARTIPLPKPVDWGRRDIHAEKGCWSIRLPKRN